MGSGGEESEAFSVPYTGNGSKDFHWFPSKAFFPQEL
jgi:hypothetical protein